MTTDLCGSSSISNLKFDAIVLPLVPHRLDNSFSALNRNSYHTSPYPAAIDLEHNSNILTFHPRIIAHWPYRGKDLATQACRHVALLDLSILIPVCAGPLDAESLFPTRSLVSFLFLVIHNHIARHAVELPGVSKGNHLGKLLCFPPIENCWRDNLPSHRASANRSTPAV